MKTAGSAMAFGKPPVTLIAAQTATLETDRKIFRASLNFPLFTSLKHPNMTSHNANKGGPKTSLALLSMNFSWEIMKNARNNMKIASMAIIMLSKFCALKCPSMSWL